MGGPVAFDRAAQLAGMLPAYFEAHFPTLPNLTPLAWDVLAIASDTSRLEPENLSRIISRDQDIADELLYLANSGYYHRGRAAGCIEEAIVRIGAREVYGMAATLATRPLFTPPMRRDYGVLPELWERVHNHCVVCALGAGWLVEHSKCGRYESAFVAGLLHDVGKLAGLFCLCGMILDHDVDPDIPTECAAQAITVAGERVGPGLLESFHLPANVVRACLSCMGLSNQRMPPLAHAVRVVSHLDTLRGSPIPTADLSRQLRASLAALHVPARRLPAIGEELAGLTDYGKHLVGALR